LDSGGPSEDRGTAVRVWTGVADVETEMVMLSRFASPCMGVRMVECDCEFVKPCSTLDLSGPPPPEDDDSDDSDCEGIGAPLLGHNKLQQHLFREGVVDAEIVPGPTRDLGDFEACAMPPCEIEVELPKSYTPGQGIPVKGPDGYLAVWPPADAEPGSVLSLRLSPRPEMRSRCSPKAMNLPGSKVKFAREDGVEVSVVLPHGAPWSGDALDMSSPLFFVRVPRGAGPGDFVNFCRREARGKGIWCRAQVPQGLLSEDLFAVRLVPQRQTTELLAI